ncbi:MAG: TonB-dependent receptor plug domain-containing protein [Cardiobacteriaceae bacterium]|nr:TonB-dependent receptor plug domain-containing protein [Cardiobacteriaceae bacterium]
MSQINHKKLTYAVATIVSTASFAEEFTAPVSRVSAINFGEAEPQANQFVAQNTTSYGIVIPNELPSITNNAEIATTLPNEFIDTSVLPQNYGDVGIVEDSENITNTDNQYTNISQSNTTSAVSSDLGIITVTGVQNNKTNEYTAKINRQQLQTSSTGNGDIASALRTLPNVRYSNTSNSSTNPGQIDPKNISISGGKYYSNKITLDGASLTSRIDPAATGTDGTSWNHGSWLGRPRGRAQSKV